LLEPCAQFLQSGEKNRPHPSCFPSLSSRLSEPLGPEYDIHVAILPERLEGAVIDIALMLATVDQLVVVSVGKAVELAVDIGLVGIATETTERNPRRSRSCDPDRSQVQIR
jgi:hypothetical protein